MNTVEPIRDINLIHDVSDYLYQQSERNYVMFYFGLYSLLRISDILQFRVRDIVDNHGRIKSHIYIREKKTGKEKRFIINKEFKPILQKYIKGKPLYEFLFKSRKGINKPIKRETAYQILKKAANVVGIESMGTHTMRKTGGYHLNKQINNTETVRKLLNHDKEETTQIYCGIDQDVMDKSLGQLSYKTNR